MSRAAAGGAPVLVCLMGPTGAGKTALALALAARFPLEIVSVDSALVYRGLDVGAAKPAAPVQRQIRHHLIDLCDPAEVYSAARFRTDALAAIADIRARGRIPFLVGGTGLYFKALEHGLAALPVSDPAIRAALEREREEKGLAALHARLREVDPDSADRIHPNDPQRVLRALEIYLLSGRPRSALWAQGTSPPLALIKFAVAPARRACLHEALAGRFYSMLDRGLINEVLMLRRRADLGPHCPAVRAVGYQQVWRYLDGEYPRGEMIARAIAATRQLAKRQFTWFRGDRAVVWLDPAERATVDCVSAALEAQQFAKNSDYNEPVNESRLDG